MDGRVRSLLKHREFWRIRRAWMFSLTDIFKLQAAFWQQVRGPFLILNTPARIRGDALAVFSVYNHTREERLYARQEAAPLSPKGDVNVKGRKGQNRAS